MIVCDVLDQIEKSDRIIGIRYGYIPTKVTKFTLYFIFTAEVIDRRAIPEVDVRKVS